MDAASPFHTVPVRVLGAAAAKLGGEGLLPQALGASPVQVACWLSGLQEPPRTVVLRALAIVLDGAERPDGPLTLRGSP